LAGGCSTKNTPVVLVGYRLHQPIRWPTFYVECRRYDPIAALPLRIVHKNNNVSTGWLIGVIDSSSILGAPSGVADSRANVRADILGEYDCDVFA
jgi:hypothetical protein